MGKKVGLVGGIFAAIVVVFALILAALLLEKIPVGYEGIIYSVNGGVQEETLDPGWHMIGPGKKVSLFTVSNEQIILTKDKRDGSVDDDSFKVATSDNASIAISFQMSYRFIPEKVVDTYKRFKMAGESIVEKRVRTVLKSKIAEVTTNYSLMDLYSGDRATINDKITEYLTESFGEAYGIEVLDASIIDVHPDEKLQQAIDNRVEAQQKADQAKAEQATAKVEAETALLKAENDAQIEKVEAQAKADVKKIEAEAEATANKKIADSITDELIRMKEAEARLKHGWVTIKGADTVVTDKESK